MSEPRCPSCGYTKHDAQIQGDHRLCKNAGNAPWERNRAKAPSPAHPTDELEDNNDCPRCNRSMATRDGDDPTKYCDHCAHELVEEYESQPAQPTPAEPSADMPCHCDLGGDRKDCPIHAAAVAPASEEEVVHKAARQILFERSSLSHIEEVLAAAIHEVADPLRAKLAEEHHGKIQTGLDLKNEQWRYARATHRAEAAEAENVALRERVKELADYRIGVGKQKDALEAAERQLELCRDTLSEIHSSGISEAAIRDRLRKLLTALQPKAASPDVREEKLND